MYALSVEIRIFDSWSLKILGSFEHSITGRIWKSKAQLTLQEF